MIKRPIKQLPTRVERTYRGGLVLSDFLGYGEGTDGFFPEDWISSFVQAKNRNYKEGEGLTLALCDGEVRRLADIVSERELGEGRGEPGVLVKLLDSAERLGIQVHPTKEYSRRVFGTPYGKTECWHILATRELCEPPCVYIGFKETVTKELWRELFMKQDIDGMLAAMHRIEVKAGDTVLVTGGTPHAIGGGVFLLEIQEPCDYTMRVERVTLAGEVLTPQQIHYGVGEELMLDCFDYTPRSEDEVRREFILSPRGTENDGALDLVTYDDTECFALRQLTGGRYCHESDSFVTAVVIRDGGELRFDGGRERLSRGEKSPVR